MRQPVQNHARPRATAMKAVIASTFVLLAALFAAPLAHADTAFSTRYSVNTNGAITSAANTLMTCPSNQSGCATLQQTATNGPQPSGNPDLDNDYNQTYVNVPAGVSAGLFDSSTATLNIPTGATVLFAGLYYGARTDGNPSPTLRGTVKMEVPGTTTFQTLSGAQLMTSTDGGDAYQGFINVTSQVTAAGAGSYTVGNVQSGTGEEAYAGWSIVVAYKLDSDPARNLTIDDGLQSVFSSNVTLSLSGFQTPPSGAVNTDLGFISYEGDEGLVGDTASLNGHALSDATHPANNFFDSAISNDGVAVTTKTPNYLNQFGYDSSFITANGDLPNGATTATIVLTTSGDIYYPGVVTFATDLYSPKITQTKTVTDVTHPGGPVQEGDTLKYDISGTNSGGDGTTNFAISDPLPANTTYVPGTLNVVSAGGSSLHAGTQTDAAGDDLAEYNATTKAVSFRLGAGSAATVGGNIAPNASYDVQFEAKVASPLPQDTTVTNTATASFNAKTLGTAEQAQSSVTSTVTAPDLTVSKTLTSGTPIVAGTNASYDITVSNAGDAPSQGTVTVSDTLPASESVAAASGNGWNCVTSADASAFTCTRSDALPAGASYPKITLTAAVSQSASGNLTNTATVSGGGDGNLANNTASASAASTQQADLSLQKTASAPSVNVGQDVTFTLTATNNGPSQATSVTASDSLPAGLAYVSSTQPGGGACTGAPAVGATGVVTCTLGTVGAHGTASATVTVRALPSAAGTTVTNTATVAGAQTDPNAGNNSASANVDVTSADLSATKTLTGNPAVLHTGDSVDYVITAKNNGPSDTTGATITDPISANLSGVSYTAPAGASCHIANATLTCVDPSLASGASFTVHLDGTIVSGAVAATQSNTATVSSDLTDPDLTNNTATVTTPLTADADLSVAKTATPDPATPNADETFTITTRNAGPDAAQGVVVSDPLPANLTYVSSTAGGSYDTATRTVTWNVGTIAPNGSAAVKVTALLAATATGTLTNSAAAQATTPDPDPSNNTGTSVTTIVDAADLELSKTVDNSAPAQGTNVTYTLTAKNDGPSQAVATSITDALPAGVTYVSDDDHCTVTGQSLTCPVGTLASGDSTVVHVVASVDPVTTAHPGQTLQLDTQKVDTSFSLQGGETQTDTASCPSGYFFTDGSAEISAVDQGTGTLASVNVLAAYDSAPGTYTVKLQNTATGQAQGHITGVCEAAQTAPGQQSGQSGTLTTSAPVTQTALLMAGEHTTTLDCGPGQTAIDPGFQFDGPATVRSSEPAAGGQDWTFVVDVPESVNATLSIVCLNNRVADGQGNLNPLEFTTVTKSVSVAPGSSAMQVSVTCPTGYEGIVASYTLDPGLLLVGTDPQPITRVFSLYNSTSQTLNASLDLLCLAIQTGPEVSTAAITNSASVSSTTEDPNPANNTASATFTANGIAPAQSTGSGNQGSGNQGSGNQGSGSGSGSGSGNSSGSGSGSGSGNGSHAAPNAPAKTATTANPVTVSSKALTLAGTRAASVKLSCAPAAGCSGTVELVSTKAVHVGGKVIAAGTVLGSTGFHLAAGKSATVRIKVAARYAKVLAAQPRLRVTLRSAQAGVAASSRRLRVL